MTKGKRPMRVTVLGSTGSIGANTLDVIARHPERFKVHALAAARQVDALLAQCVRFKPRFAVMAQPEAARELAEKLKSAGLSTQVLSGPAGMDEVSSDPDVDPKTPKPLFITYNILKIIKID